MKTSMAIDQYGNTLHDLGPYPRKGLLIRLSAKHADKVYVDRKDGKSIHIGYIIQGRWFTIYYVERMEKPVR